MSTSRAWNWLAPRRSVNALFGEQPANHPPRPCLPQMEPLGDRVMLSLVVPSPEVALDQVLIGLLKGTFGETRQASTLMQTQLTALEAVHKLPTPPAPPVPIPYPNIVGHHLTQSFLKINTILYKFSQARIDGIEGESQDSKHKNELEFLNTEISKLDAFIRDIGAEDTLLMSAVQDVTNAASKLFSDISLIEMPGKIDFIDFKLQQVYSKITHDFLNVSSGLLKLGEDILFRKAGETPQEYVKIKIENVLVSDYKLISDNLKIQLIQIAETALHTMQTLLQPPQPPGDIIVIGPFTGGVSIVGEILDDSTDDSLL